MPDPVREDFWRVRPSASSAVAFKEWQHFVVLAPGLDVLVNFSLGSLGSPGSPPGSTGDGERLGRVIVLVRTSRWTGFVDTVARLAFSSDGARGQFGEHRVELRDAGYRVVVDAPAHGVVIDVTMRPATVPVTARRQRLAPGRHLDWSLTARLAVDGRVEAEGRSYRLAGAVGYHDHNWGQFAWGDDFTWEWGSVLPLDGRADWAVVYSSLLNGARTERALEQVFVWRGGLNVLAAGGADVTARSRGRYRARPELRLPRPMALVQPRLDADVPRRLDVTARGAADELTLRFTPESTAQLLVPSERSPRRVVTINECVGPVALEGQLAGQPIHWEGRGVFELVRH
jgi:hypothetical protein